MNVQKPEAGPKLHLYSATWLSNGYLALLHLAHKAKQMKSSKGRPPGVLPTSMSSMLYSHIRSSAVSISLSVNVSKRRILRAEASLRKLVGSLG